MFAVFVFDVSDDGINIINKMSNRMSDFSCVSPLNAVKENVVTRAVELFAYMAIF